MDVRSIIGTLTSFYSSLWDLTILRNPKSSFSSLLVFKCKFDKMDLPYYINLPDNI